MKKSTILASTIIALGLALGAPAAAMAAPYAPIPGETTQSVAPGAPVTLTTAGWLPGELITVTYPDSFTLAASTAIVASGSGTASLSFSSTGSAAGSFSIAFVGAVSGTVSFAITVDPALAYTGTSDPTPYLWLGGGLAVLGAAAVVTVIAVRRQNSKEQVGA
jgi:hypothetical protein